MDVSRVSSQIDTSPGQINKRMPIKLNAVASLAKERTAWNKVMTSTYGVKLKGTNRFKRTTRKKEKRRARRVPKYDARNVGDIASRVRMLHDKRLQILDANNAGDDPDGAGDNEGEDGDEEYEDDEDYDDDEETTSTSSAGSKRKRKVSKTKSSRKTKKSKATGDAAKALERNKKLPRPCTLEQALLDPEADAIYSSVLTLPTNCLARNFCPVTGVVAGYRDPATGVPYATKAAYSIIAQRAPRIW